MKQFKQMVVQGERGQAIVLIALFMVVMLAMVGVAIDGGGLFWLWRNAQNAADTAALQAAYDKCTGGAATWVQQGIDAAEINGFVDQDNPGVNDVVVDLYTPPGETTAYVRVRIEATKPKYFIQLVYSGNLQVTAQALVYCSEAVDFSDLPGIVALGGCGCGTERVRMNGSRLHIEGGIHSNCDVYVSANNSGDAGVIDDGVSTPGGDPDIGTSNVTINGGENVSPVVTKINELRIDLYFPEGEIYEEIERTYPLQVHHVNGDKDFSSADNPLEGLWAVEGNVTFPTTANSITFGERGLTVVAHGTIDYKNTDRGSLTNNWHYYGHAYTGPSAAAPYNDPGVMVDYSRGTGSGILMFTDWQSSDPDSCGAGNNNTGIKWQGNGDGDDTLWDLDLWGLILAPNSSIAWSGSKATVRGGIYGMTVDMQGSDNHLIPDPNLLQPMAPVMNNAQ